MHNFAQKFAAEFVGTFAVVFIAAGSICSDQYLAASNQARLGVLGIALAYGLVYAAMVSALGHISGGYFNPAVTVGLWVMRRVGTLQGLSYVIAQLVGGISATYLLVALMPDAGWRTRALGSITPDLSPDITRGQGMVIEAVLTFLLVFVIFATAIDAKRALQKFTGFVSGLALLAGVLMAFPFTGGSMNPARSFGPAVVTHHWENHGVYWVGPLLGGILASVVYDRFFLRDQPPGSTGASLPSGEVEHHSPAHLGR
ncbi:MAG: MIP family channel protein [Candidatus Acidiferrales bacterium]